MPLAGILFVWFFEDVPLVEFVYLVFTRMTGESDHGRLKSLLFSGCTSGGVYVPCIYSHAR